MNVMILHLPHRPHLPWNLEARIFAWVFTAMTGFLTAVYWAAEVVTR